MSKKPKLVCIGNSIVNGFPHRRSECFVSLLREALPEYDVMNKGENGDTAMGVKSRFQKDVLDKHPYAAMLLTGTNDFILGSSSVDGCLETIKELTEAALKQGTKIILLTPIICDAEKASAMWMPADYEKANRQLMELSEKMKSYADEINSAAAAKLAGRPTPADDCETAIMKDVFCKVIDLQECYRSCNDFVDGIHPSVHGHEVIARHILENI